MQLSYEDRLRVWMAALLKGMAYWNGRGLLIPVPQAVEELNALPRPWQTDAGRSTEAHRTETITDSLVRSSQPLE